MFFSKQFETRVEAREKEKFFKGGSVKEFLKNLAI